MLAYETERRPTQHYRSRSAERALKPDVEAFLMTWGTETRAAGATHLTIVRRDLPPEVRDSKEAARAEGWIVVASHDGSLLTCYRRRDAWHFLRRKSQMRPRRRSRRA